MKADYTYIGNSKIDKETYNWYNCERCGSTISERNQLKHIKDNHYKRYHEIQQHIMQNTANRFTKYITNKKGN